MRGAIPPLPQYAFMASYLVKAKGQLYLSLLCISKSAISSLVMRLPNSNSVRVSCFSKSYSTFLHLILTDLTTGAMQYKHRTQTVELLFV
jgi:hypothetical protein